MYYLVHAYETSYQGLHGIENWEIYEADSEKAILQNALDLSRDVIEQFGLDDEYLEEEGLNEDARDEVIKDHIAFEIYPLKDGVKEISEDELRDLIFYNPEELLEKYSAGEAL